MAKYEDRFVNPKFRGVSIAALICRPFIAAVKANEEMAKEQAKFLMDVCFSRDGDVYEPVMITLSMTRGFIETSAESASIKPLTMTFQVPLITILSHSFLGLENFDLEFNMEVHSHYEIDEEGDEDLFAAKSSSSSGSRAVEMTGRIDGDAALSVTATAGALPLPPGITTIIEAYTKAILPSDPADPAQKKDTW